MKRIKKVLTTKPLLMALFIFAYVPSAIGQEKTDAMLFGDVKVAGTKEHIPYATLQVKGTKHGTTSDGSGHYKLSNIPIGTLVIVVQALGYKKAELEVVMMRGKSTELFVELEPDVLMLDQVVVSGTRTEHSIKDVPIRTEVISIKSIQDKNACNIYQALDGTPGIRVENQCQACNFTMVRMQGLGAEHTQVLINGQPMYSGLAGVYGLQQMGTTDVGRIEVVKGAGSALSGSSAVAGAINIITKEPSLEPSTTIDFQLGNYNTNKYDISSSLRNEKGNIGATIYAQRTTEGIIDQTGTGMTLTEVNKKDGISDRVTTNLTNAGFGLFFYNTLLNNDKLIVRGKSIFEKRQGGVMTDDSYKNPFTLGTESITTDRYEAELAYSAQFKNKSEINFTMGYINHNRDATNDSFLSDYMTTHHDSTPEAQSMRPYLANENSMTATFTFGKKFTKHGFLIGIQTFLDNLEESGMYTIVDTNSSYYGGDYKSISTKSAKEFGIFIQDEWGITKKLTFVPGIRFDSHHSGESYATDRQISDLNSFPKTNFSETSVNPRVALKYELNDKITFRANSGTGFRAPYGFSEDLHLCSGSPRVWKSSSLNPETSISYNLSMDYYGKNFRVSTNIFRTDLKNKIGFTDADANIAALGYDYQWKNIDDAFVQGVELTIIASFIKNLDLGVDLTYNQGEYINAREDWIGTVFENVSKKISRFPVTTGNLKIEYSPKTWSFTLIGNYSGNMYIDYYSEIEGNSKIKETEPYTLFNFRASKKIGLFKIYGGVNNIFNVIQDERHLDDAAFMYAPVYGTMFYGGVAIEIKH